MKLETPLSPLALLSVTHLSNFRGVWFEVCAKPSGVLVRLVRLGRFCCCSFFPLCFPGFVVGVVLFVFFFLLLRGRAACCSFSNFLRSVDSLSL